jgi:hypothetical protein
VGEAGFNAVFPLTRQQFLLLMNQNKMSVSTPITQADSSSMPEQCSGQEAITLASNQSIQQDK